MSSRKNLEAMANFVESLGRTLDDPDSMKAFLADDVVVTDWMLPGVTLQGKEELFERWFKPLEVSFPDFIFEVHDTIVAGDALILRGDFVATFQADYVAWTREPRTVIKAHGRPVRWTAHDIYLFRDGRIARVWFGNDSLTVGRQLGWFPDNAVPW